MPMNDLKITWMSDIQYFSPLLTELPGIRHIVETMIREAGGGGGVELKFCEDREIRLLNRRFLGIDSPTNVLSFPSDEEDSFLGSLCVSIETIEREALLYGVGRMEHLCRMILHGILHLCGYQHGEEMYLREEEIFANILEEIGAK